ncbi:MAG: response regulator [Gammaproteobacteria bacterium]|nr:response regulator [Gammaproteobacteria bacterium]
MSNQSLIRVLMVGDNLGDLRLVQEMLTESGANQFFLEHVRYIKHALDNLVQTHYDVLLLDLALPDGRGLNNVNKIQAAAPGLPIIVLSGISDEQLALQAVKAGAQDYLVRTQKRYRRTPGRR